MHRTFFSFIVFMCVGWVAAVLRMAFEKPLLVVNAFSDFPACCILHG